ncbi:hypothetical protein BKA65DRAFT_94430 [Rhexocercosporidium sp. MPI-PUGE-AT-0058]|nr:hypothetical protein BKA65DRAFT_94430 [Rhexocercosporidium sp. MPI-PUGE-AT-0058]
MEGSEEVRGNRKGGKGEEWVRIRIDWTGITQGGGPGKGKAEQSKAKRTGQDRTGTENNYRIVYVPGDAVLNLNLNLEGPRSGSSRPEKSCYSLADWRSKRGTEGQKDGFPSICQRRGGETEKSRGSYNKAKNLLNFLCLLLVCFPANHTVTLIRITNQLST